MRNARLMKISVALCTYNGSRYLQEQLDSIAAQTRRPDEIVISDDASTDGTLETAERFAATAAAEVHIVRGEQNIGSDKNFERAIAKCSGDIIFLADQDDVWLPHKVERMMRGFDDPQVGMAFSNAKVVDAELRPLGLPLWRWTFRAYDRKMFAEGRAAEVLLYYNVVTGATMAFRRSLVSAALPIPKLTGMIHDGWISLIASLTSRVAAVDEQLILYRQHDAQQLGVGHGQRDASRADQHRRIVEERLRANERFDQFAELFDEARLAAMRAAAPMPELVPDRRRLASMLEAARLRISLEIAHLQTRMNYPKLRIARIAPVLAELYSGRYYEFSRGGQSALLDTIRK